MNKELQERLPNIIRLVRLLKSAVAQAGIECAPDEYLINRDAWYKPFEEIQEELDKIEFRIKTKLREHE